MALHLQPIVPPDQCAQTLLVIDTNIVLDVFLFDDPRARDVRHQLHTGSARWMASPHMREELRRVLHHAHVHKLMTSRAMTAEQVMADFDRYATVFEPDPVARLPKARPVCKDPDDQPFVDLACDWAARCTNRTVCLLSRDKAVLALRKPLSQYRVQVQLGQYFPIQV